MLYILFLLCVSSTFSYFFVKISRSSKMDGFRKGQSRDKQRGQRRSLSPFQGYVLPLERQNSQEKNYFAHHINPSSSIQHLEAGKWTNKQQRIYIKFIEEHREELLTKQARKASKIFKKMSHVVQTRTPDQCRSHHQKLSQYHHTVDNIINEYKTVFQQRTGTTTEKEIKGQIKLESGFYSLKTTDNVFKIYISDNAIKCYSP